MTPAYFSQNASDANSTVTMQGKRLIDMTLRVHQEKGALIGNVTCVLLEEHRRYRQLYLFGGGCQEKLSLKYAVQCCVCQALGRKTFGGSSRWIEKDRVKSACQPTRRPASEYVDLELWYEHEPVGNMGAPLGNDLDDLANRAAAAILTRPAAPSQKRAAAFGTSPILKKPATYRSLKRPPAAEAAFGRAKCKPDVQFSADISEILEGEAHIEHHHTDGAGLAPVLQKKFFELEADGLDSSAESESAVERQSDIDFINDKPLENKRRLSKTSSGGVKQSIPNRSWSFRGE
eukprot:6458282-Amphidinium_carterae.1